MESEKERQQNVIQTAATAPIDIHNPARGLNTILTLATDLLGAECAILFEADDELPSYTPRAALGLQLGELGRLAAAPKNPATRNGLTSDLAFNITHKDSPFGTSLGKGRLACAPCQMKDKTVGLLFVAGGQGDTFDEEALACLEILAGRASTVLTFAHQSSTQSYLFNRLSLLYQASHAMAATHDRRETVRQLGVHLLKATSADRCEILVTDDGFSMLARLNEKPGRAPEMEIEEPASEGLPEYPLHQNVLQSLRPARLCLTPASGSAKDLAMLQAENLAAAAVFALAVRNRPIGLVRLLVTKEKRQITDQEMDLANAIASIGAMGLQDAIHLEKAQTTASQLKVLGDIGREVTSTLDLESALRNAMGHAQHLLEVEACVLFLVDEERKKLVLKASGGSELRIRGVEVGLDEGIAGWVTRERQPLTVNDVRANPHYQSGIDSQTGLLTTSILCVPLETRGEIVGVIEAINHPRNAFAEPDLRMLSSVAAWAAIALDNAHLFQRVAEERRRLEATLVETADAVVLTDPQGRLILVNKAAQKAFGLGNRQVEGCPADEVFQEGPFAEVLVSGEITLPTTLEITTPTERVLHASISEVSDVGRVAVMQDITALKQIDRMRSQLLGTAAHDLKNPLNAIRLGADLLNDAPLNNQQRKALNMMQRATDSMTSLVTGLLETIRVESTTNLMLEVVQIQDLIRRAIEDLRPLADAKQHMIEFNPPGETLLTMGDPARLNSVMANLLANAIKFTDPGGLIRILLDWSKEEITVCVSDNGPGIQEDEIPRVFEHLFRGRAAVRDPNNPVEGTGLGLAMAKIVVEQHGGRIWVTSKPGEGSKFYFTLPRELHPRPGLQLEEL
jgi:PAS domain S-box-containing protein